jgi:hypothetical protein
VSDSLDQLGADYPGWRMWQNEDGQFIAWWLATDPRVLVRAVTVVELRQAVEREMTGDEPA